MLPTESESPDEPREKMPPYVIFSAGQGVSAVGTWMQKTGVGWLTWELTHSPAWVGAIAMSDLIAAFWVAPLAGAVTDRSNPFRLILLTQSLMIIMALLLWGFVASGVITIWLLLGWAIVDATAQGFNQPVRMVAIGSLAPANKMSQAIATNSVAANLARSVGPAIAGLVMVAGDISYVFLINSISYLAMIMAIFRLRRYLDRPGLSSRKDPILQDIASGFNYIHHTPMIAGIFLLTVGFSLLARPFVELLPAIAGAVFDGGPQTLSTLMTAQGIGALLGATWMLKAKPANTLVAITFGSAVGLAFSLVFFSLVDDFYVAVAAIGIAGMFHVLCNIGMQSMAQTLRQPSMKGRVMALYGLIFRAGPALGAFTLGAAAHWINLQWLLGMTAALFGALVIYKIPAAKKIYTSPSE